MTERKNVDRALDALKVVELHALRTGIEREAVETRIVDLLANIMHLCDDKGLDQDEMIERAAGHYREEYTEENPLPATRNKALARYMKGTDLVIEMEVERWRNQCTVEGHWTDHPIWEVADWQEEVAQGATRQGYRDWVASQIESRGERR